MSRSPLRLRTTATPIREATADEVMSLLRHGMDERQVPLNARGGLLGVYGYGPNPAREYLDRLEKPTDEQ